MFESMPIRIGLLLALLCCGGVARADLTGVGFEIGDTDVDWDFDGDLRAAKSTLLRLSFEERSSSGLTVGGALGYLSMRVDGDEDIDTTKFEVENLLIYLRQEFALNDSFSWHAMFSYGYYNGRENSSEDRAEINWSEVNLGFGASYQKANLRFTPFVKIGNVDGDISGGDFTRTQTFDLEDPISYGLEFDIFVEPTAFVGIRLQTGNQSGGYLSFVRRY